VSDIPDLGEVGIDGLAGHEVGFKLVNINVSSFETPTGLSAIGGTNVIVGEKAIDVGHLAIKRVKPCVLHGGTEKFVIELLSEFPEASPVISIVDPTGF
jgi:hypothetical protein